MKSNNIKGFALVEMILVIALIAIVLPLIYQIYMYGQESFTSGNRIIAQQYTVNNVMTHIRGDIEQSASVTTTTTAIGVTPQAITLKLGYIKGSSTTINKYRYWRFYCRASGEEGKLQYSGEKDAGDILNESDFLDVVIGLDIDNCKFERSDSNNDKLIIEIKPIETNTGKNQARNMREAIRTEVSVLYKD